MQQSPNITLIDLIGKGERLHSNLSRMTMVVWLFVALVIMQTYTANLISMLTVQHLGPTVTDVEALKSSNAIIGHCTGSFLSKYLVDVLHFNANNIKNFNSIEAFAQALETQEIAAAFLEVPLANLFLAKYCKGFTIAGPTYKVGGFGFVILLILSFEYLLKTKGRVLINYTFMFFEYLRLFQRVPHWFPA